MRFLFALTASFLFLTGCTITPAGGKTTDSERAGWVALFDGKTLDGWKKAEENPDSVRVEDGKIVTNGPRCHLFYDGDAEPFVNFELEAEILTKENSNSGVYFHTRYQPSGWPKYGFEAQVNNSFKGDPRRTASIYGVDDTHDASAKDDEWFIMNVKVEGKRVVVSVNGKVIKDYTEPEGREAGADFTRVFDKGTFGLQAHDPGSTVYYRSIRVRRLP